MKKIALTKGFKAIVDYENYDIINAFKWNATARKNGEIYITRTQRYGQGSKKKKIIYLHREIMQAKKGEYVDHINAFKFLDFL